MIQLKANIRVAGAKRNDEVGNEMGSERMEKSQHDFPGFFIQHVPNFMLSFLVFFHDAVNPP